MIRVTVWNEGVHEAESREVAAVYPEGIHGQLKSFLGAQEDMEVRTATLREPDCGLPPEVLENTDVLIWWGHKAHDEVPDELVERVHDRVLRGMGFHSTALRAFFKAVQASHGHLLRPALARRRFRARLDSQPRAPDSKGA